MKDSSAEKSKKSLRLRSFLILIMGAFLAVASGYVIFDIYSAAEHSEFRRDFNTLADGIANGCPKSLDYMFRTSDHCAAVYSAMFPDADAWPNVALPRFASMFNPLIESVFAKNINHIPLVLPGQLSSFEAFAYNFFETDPETKAYPDLGVSPFGEGVFAINSTTGERYHDTTGATSFTDANFLTPVFQVGNLETNSKIVMLNTHNEITRGVAINAVMNCFAEKAADAASSQGCGALTDFIYLLQDTVPTPASIYYYPEFPFNNNTFLSGFIGAVFNWDTVVRSTIPYLEDSDAKLVLNLRTETSSNIYFTSKTDDVQFIGQGVYDGSQKDHKRSAEIGSSVGFARGSVSFRLDIYPHDDMVNAYITSTPMILSVSVACLVLLIAVLLSYADYYISAQVYEVQVASRLRKTFLRYISHELRSPLNAVYMGVTELLLTLNHGMSDIRDSTEIVRQAQSTFGANGFSRGENVDMPPREIAKSIKRDTEMAMMVLDDLVTYVSLVEGKEDSSRRRPATVCLKHIVENSLESVKHMLVDYCQTIHLVEQIDVGDSPVALHPTVAGHASDMQMMFANMLKVAIKMCSPNNEIQINFSVTQTPRLVQLRNDSDLSVRVIISYPETVQHAEQIQALKRTDSSSSLSNYSLEKLRSKTQSEFISSDLGNWIVYYVANRYHGDVDIANGGGQTLIFFTFPHVVASSPSEDLEVGQVVLRRSLKQTHPDGNVQDIIVRGDVSSSPRPAHSRKTVVEMSVIPTKNENEVINPADVPKKLRILCVDDVPSNRKMLSRLLTRRGHTCMLASDGQEAMSLIVDHSTAFDAICMDYEMPIMDGPTATKALRDLGVEIPIIGVTGNVLPEDVEHFKNMGAQAVVGKPVDILLLDETLLRLVSMYQLKMSMRYSSFTTDDEIVKVSETDFHDTSIPPVSSMLNVADMLV